MKLYLVRHGEAKSKSEDPTRPLNGMGLRNANTMAAWMRKAGESAAEIRHSGKKRAEQTAEIFGNHLSPPHGVLSTPGLKPNDDILPAVDMLDGLQDPLMIVGHLPFLSKLTSYLVTGEQDTEVVRFQNAGVVCLVGEQGHWSVAWVVAPSLIMPESRK
ncbi:MAG: phosphohistidine phosphatase SixA [bacterium]|nr:MAG: phosphohistidine phosphatase SixA [bacterium]